jgi:arylsulfatase
MPTLAKIIGEEERMPVDRPIDGIDQSAFLLGNQDKSNREHILVYIGDDLFAVKWRTFKIHLKTAESLWAPVQTNIFPTVYDIRNDPGEDNELMKQGLFSYSWVYGAMGQLLQSKMASMQEYRNIKPGEDFDGYE